MHTRTHSHTHTHTHTSTHSHIHTHTHIRRHGQEAAALRNMRQVTRQSVARLSGELYSSDTHFLMELIQNADDNTYAPGVRQRLTIRITDAAITLSNNEVGFSPRNVRALCSIGSSTKSAAHAGYIGHKGEDVE